MIQAFNVQLNLNQIKAQKTISGGNSGDFFFITHDESFFIKTI
jgi:hypothetical protein